MKKTKYFSITIIIILIAMGCSKESAEELVVGDKTALIEENTGAVENDYFVTQQQAIEVANAFFNDQAGMSGLRSSATIQTKASIEAIKEEQSDEPLMYIINYPEGGWAIVSATKSFYPVLAYSDKNSFEQTSDMGPAELWFAETKEAIKASKTLDELTSGEIRSIWNNYTMGDEPNRVVSNLKSATSIQQALSERIHQLTSQYGAGSSYIITTLAGTQGFLSSNSEWQSLRQFASSLGSPPEYTIIVGRKDYSTPSVGPLLQTKWHQGSPYNDLAPSGYSAGCSAIAVAQVMKYYQHPQSMTWNGFSFNWSNIPVEPKPGSAHAALVRLVGQFLGVSYMSIGTWATPGSVEDGLKSLGYNVTRRNHNYSLVSTQLLTYRRPVVMVGAHMDLPLPKPAAYIGKSHYWVCDGAKEMEHNITYFIEFINTSNNTYYNHPQIYRPSNPFKSHQYKYQHCHMNWGWQNGSNNGWYLFNDVKTNNGDYQYVREDFYISKP
jgi:hypothetical protein